MESTREVLIRLKLVTDKATEQATRAVDSELKKIDKSIDGIKESWKKAVEEERKSLEKVAKDQQKFLAQVKRDYDRHVAALQAGQMQLAEGSKLAIQGVVTFARGAAVALASSEEEASQLAKRLVAIVGFFDMLRGGIDIVVGMTKAWRAYTTVVESAAAAQKALAAAQAATAATGVAAGAGSAAGGAGLGVGASAIGVAGAIAPLAAVGVAGAAVLTGIISIFDTDFKDSLLNFFDNLNKGEQLAAEWAQEQQRRVNRAQRYSLGLSEQDALRQARLGALGLEAQAGDLDAATAARKAVEAGLGAQPSLEGASAMVAATTREVQALQAAKQLSEDRLRTEQQRIREQTQAAQQELDKTKAILETEKQRADMLQERQMSAAERFGGLSSEEQARLLAIKKRADSGAALTREEAAALRGIGLEQSSQYARDADVARARAAGFFGAFGANERAQEAASRANVAKMEVKVDEITHRIEVDFKSQADNVASQIASKLADWNEQIAEAVARKIVAEFSQQRVVLATQAAASARQ